MLHATTRIELRIHVAMRMRIIALVVGSAFLLPGVASAATAKAVQVVLPPDASPISKNIARLLARQIRQRCEVDVTVSDKAMLENPLIVKLAIHPGIGKEGFNIADGSSGIVEITGNDERGLLYGVGKFLRTSRYDEGGFTPGTWRGQSAPRKPVRGIYLATHNNNFYHAAPIEEVNRYVEELALWGNNVLLMWYDMHHFDSFDQPEAVEFRKRLYAIFNAAKQIGLDVGIGVIANEGYDTSPAALRADPSARRGGWYDCQICPSKPGGMEYILSVMGQEFDWCAELHPQYLWIWPYDQGGCGCPQCMPWGSNGFVKTAKQIASLAGKKLPEAKIIVSAWYFDYNEWQGLTNAIAEKTPWADYVMAEAAAESGKEWMPNGLPTQIPGRLPVIDFPEISSVGTFPWGGFGATPLPFLLQKQWNIVKHKIAGGFPYSEGIYEDITKAVISQFYWDDRPAEETLREYVAFEYSPDVVDEIIKVIATLEQNHHMRWWPGELEGVKLDLDWFPSRGVKPQSDPGAEVAYATVQRVDNKLSLQARQSWRWRQLYLRTLLDAELKANGGSSNDRCNEAFAELIRIYHAQNANPVVRPPLDPMYRVKGP